MTGIGRLCVGAVETSARKLPGISEDDPNEDCHQWGALSLNWPCLVAM